MSPISTIRRLAAAAALFAAGCAQIPLVELEGYASAFDTAHVAGDLVLDELATAEKIQALAPGAPRGGCEISDREGFRGCFTLSLALGEEAKGRNEVVDLKVRRFALDQIAGYNQLLVDLAQGKSADALNEQIDRLQILASDVVGIAGVPAVNTGLTGVAAFVDVAQPFLGKLETMRASNAAAASVTAAAADVRALIRLMQEDTEFIYDVFVTDYRLKLKRRLSDSLLAPDEATRNAIMAELAAKQDPNSPQNAARAFEKSLIAYVQLLDASDKALVALVQAIEAPATDPIASATQFAQRATEMRVLADEFLDRIRAVRAPGS